MYNSGKVMFLINEKGENHYKKGSFTLMGVFIANFFCIFAIKIELFFFLKDIKKIGLILIFHKINLMMMKIMEIQLQLQKMLNGIILLFSGLL